MFNNSLLAKVMMMAMLMIFLLFPLSMIESKISERQSLQAEVQQEIARTASGPQILAGPYLLLQYRLRETNKTTDDKGRERVQVTESELKEQIVTPLNLSVVGDAKVENRSRGIYQARLFTWQSQLRGKFYIPLGYGLNKPLSDIIPVAAYFVVKVSDSRGIRNVPVLQLNGQAFAFTPGSVGSLGGNGIHVPLKTLSTEQAQQFDFSFPLELQGTSRLSVAPVAGQTEVSLQSEWLHPSFVGSYLPRTRIVDENGFRAQWLVSNLSRNMEANGQEVFAVEFINPINIYSLAERAVKYGLLFVVLIFTAFFVFELLRNLRIHPMQYLLVGLAQAMFFLLIISLSEHIAFWMAYLISGLACVMLIGIYLAGVLHTYKPALSFASGIALMYLVLYGVLQSEDNALLMGSLLMFGALASVMLLTRNMNWYQLNIKPVTAITQS